MSATDNLFESATAALPPMIQSELKEVLNEGAVIPSEMVTRWSHHLSTSVGHLMIWILPVAKHYARVPISNYRVGAVALDNRGDLHMGANIEFREEALCFTVHAEQCATNQPSLAERCDRPASPSHYHRALRSLPTVPVRTHHRDERV